MKKSPRPMPSREHQIPKKGHKLEKVEEDGEPKQPAPTIYGVTSAQTASRKLKHRSSALMIQKRKRGDWGEFDLAHAWSPEDLQNDGRVSQSTVHAERPGRESFASNETRPYEMEPAKTFEVRIYFICPFPLCSMSVSMLTIFSLVNYSVHRFVTIPYSSSFNQLSHSYVSIPRECRQILDFRVHSRAILRQRQRLETGLRFP